MIDVAGKGRGQIADFGELRMVRPGVEGQTAPGELGEALAPRLVGHQARRGIGAGRADPGILVEAGLVADADEPAVAGGDLGIEHRSCPSAQPQVDMAHDGSAGAQIAVDAAGAHRRDAVGELRLTDAAQLGRAVLAIHRMAVDEHRGHDVVAGLGVGQQIVEHVVVAGALPEMMVRIDDRQRGFQRFLRHLGDPCVVDGNDIAQRLGRRAHGVLIGSVPCRSSRRGR